MSDPAEPAAAPAPEGSVFVDGAAYAVRLPVFDGPLDLLLHLIRREELDIFDIPIARLTKAYLHTLELMRQLQIEPASEFLVMAATLLQIKSRLLLPRPPALDDIDDEGDPRTDLVRQLLEYQRFKEVAVGLGGCTLLGWDVFDRPGGLDRPRAEIDDDDLADQDVFRLAEAFRRLVERGGYVAPHDIYVERVSIGERIAQIADHLALEGRATFEHFCGGARYREEIITTFLALLEMARLKLIRVDQTDRLGPLYIEARVGAIGHLGEQAAGMLGDVE